MIWRPAAEAMLTVKPAVDTVQPIGDEAERETPPTWPLTTVGAVTRLGASKQLGVLLNARPNTTLQKVVAPPVVIVPAKSVPVIVGVQLVPEPSPLPWEIPQLGGAKGSVGTGALEP